MAVSAKLKALLDGAKVKYKVMTHPVVYTAQEIAAAQHIPGRQLAKCVLVKTDRGPTLAVLPAVHRIDFKKLKSVLGVKSVSIANEEHIKAQFPDVEVGAMSPFGNLYSVPVVVDRDLGQTEEIVFNAGSHTDTIKMRYQDFAGLVKPKTGAFGQPFPGPKPAKTKKAASSKRKTARAKTKASTRAKKKTKSRR